MRERRVQSRDADRDARPPSGRELVGERLAARDAARRPLEGGILVVRASDGPWGAQARFLSEQIRERADAALGTGSVKAVRIVVGSASRRSAETAGQQG